MKRVYTEEQKARNKIYKAKWQQENKEKQKQKMLEWHKANPEYSREHQHKHDLGYWVVYLIHNYNGLENDYCGQTQNIHNRMIKHKHLGKLNTETHEILEKFGCKFEALAFEATLHLDGYHGKN